MTAGPANWEQNGPVVPMRHPGARRIPCPGTPRDQGEARGDAPVVQWDEKFGLVKVLPLVSWLEADVWAYIVKHDVPYNPLHDRNYPSIGCTHCTLAVKKGDDLRSGRWQGMDKVECGLHTAGEPVPIVGAKKLAG